MTASAQHSHKNNSTEAQAATALAADGYTRLHISPLDDDLLQIILPTAVRPKAQGISFHSLQTFPEKRYGFVNLPLADADKIRKKLNGAILRGTKLRIEPARPDDYMAPPAGDQQPLEDDDAGEDGTGKKDKSKKHKREKKRKRDYGEIPGVELEDGRKVKRGWTVSAAEAQTKRRDRDKSKDKDKKKKDKKEKKRSREVKSKYSDGPEALVKTRLPPNKADLAGKEDDDAESRKKRKKSKSREVVVHEFEKTTKFPTFLKQSQASSSATGPTEYVEGKGWVDADGNVVEPVKSTRPAVSQNPRPSKTKQSHTQDEDDETSSSGSSSSSEDEEDEAPAAEDSDVDVEEDAVSSPGLKQGDLAINTDITSPQSAPGSARPKSSGSARSLTIKIPPATPAAQKVHPLEALYKRPKPDENASTPAVTSDAKPFSFFDSEDIGEETPAATRASQMPMTPFTQQDFDWRNIRSAAPTPDTAHPNKTFKWPTEDDLEEEVEEDEEGVGTGNQVADPEDNDSNERPEEDEDADGEDKVAANPSTDFQKWFWEHRGDLNRSWKTRRKMAAKEKRYRENRARADRAI